MPNRNDYFTILLAFFWIFCKISQVGSCIPSGAHCGCTFCHCGGINGHSSAGSSVVGHTPNYAPPPIPHLSYVPPPIRMSNSYKTPELELMQPAKATDQKSSNAFSVISPASAYRFPSSSGLSHAANSASVSVYPTLAPYPSPFPSASLSSLSPPPLLSPLPSFSPPSSVTLYPPPSPPREEVIIDDILTTLDHTEETKSYPQIPADSLLTTTVSSLTTPPNFPTLVHLATSTYASYSQLDVSPDPYPSFYSLSSRYSTHASSGYTESRTGSFSAGPKRPSDVESSTENYSDSGKESSPSSFQSDPTYEQTEPTTENQDFEQRKHSGQIQVTSSKWSTEDYLPVMKPAKSTSLRNYVTYYNQKCVGEVMGVASNETFSSAVNKCVRMNCQAVNTYTVEPRFYEVQFLRYAKRRDNKLGYYCLSLTMIPFRAIDTIPRKTQIKEVKTRSFNESTKTLQKKSEMSHRRLKSAIRNNNLGTWSNN